MTTRITQIEDEQKKRTTIRVEGSLHGEDAEVLESTLMSLQSEQMQNVAIDLSNISFLDSESASVLRRLKTLGVELVGLHLFVQQILELAQGSETN
jgi:anti-anti-sigma regulatory factor